MNEPDEDEEEVEEEDEDEEYVAPDADDNRGAVSSTALASGSENTEPGGRPKAGSTIVSYKKERANSTSV